jgi:iron complex outermembrane receptor protein
VEAGLSTADSDIGIGPAPSLDLHDPVYLPRLSPPALQPTRYDVLRFGAYVQDQVRLNPSIVLVPGFRVSRLDVDDRIASDATQGYERDSHDLEASPSLGVVVQPRSWLSLYASGVRGFEPPTPGQYRVDGRALDVADSTSLEGGVKFDLLDGRLAAMGTAFGLRRTNVPEADGLGFYRQIGEGRSRGIELELTGRVAAGLFVQAGYAWTDTEVTRSDDGTLGRELPNAPNHLASVWTRYRLREGLLGGLMLSGGVVYVSDRFVAADNVNIAPAYTRLDLSGSYELRGPRLRIGVAASNVTNARYAMSGAGRQLFAGAPRRIAVQLTSWFE